MKASRARKLLLLGLLYLGVPVALSTLEVSYAWRSPLEVEGGSVEWYASVGWGGGAFELRNHEHLATGFAFGIGAPRICLSPVLGIVGPEGGVALVSGWFVGLVAWLIHVAVLSVRDEVRTSTARWISETPTR